MTTPFAKTALAATALALAAAGAQGQSWNMISDLDAYRVESVHGDWRVLCTALGQSGGNLARDCIVEDRYGALIFVHPGGYYGFSMRGAIAGDGIFGGAEQSHNGIEPTYFGPSFFEDHIGSLTMTRQDEPYVLSSNGLAEAHREALRMMAPM